jgi:hypothetical protein
VAAFTGSQQNSGDDNHISDNCVALCSSESTFSYLVLFTPVTSLRVTNEGIEAQKDK